LEIREIGESSRKLKTIREIKEKSGNFGKIFWKIKIFGFKEI